MLVEFTPVRRTRGEPGQGHDTDLAARMVASLQDFSRRYVNPLGLPRKAVAFDGGVVTLSVDAPGALALVPITLAIASGTLDMLEISEKVLYPGDKLWIGDLEPESPILRRDRIGPEFYGAGVFRYEPPPYDRETTPRRTHADSDWAEFLVRFKKYDSYDGELRNGKVCISATPGGLAQLAQDLVYIAQPAVPINAILRLSQETTPGYFGPPLVIRRATFPADSPWVLAQVARSMRRPSSEVGGR